MDNRQKLKEVIGAELDYLKGLEKGTDEHAKNVEIVVKLIDRDTAIEKLEVEHKATNEAQRNELSMKAKQMRDEQIDRYVRNGLTAVAVIGEIVLLVWGTNKTLRFEEFGTVTSTAGRKFTNKLFFWKK